MREVIVVNCVWSGSSRRIFGSMSMTFSSATISCVSTYAPTATSAMTHSLVGMDCYRLWGVPTTRFLSGLCASSPLGLVGTGGSRSCAEPTSLPLVMPLAAPPPLRFHRVEERTLLRGWSVRCPRPNASGVTAQLPLSLNLCFALGVRHPARGGLSGAYQVVDSLESEVALDRVPAKDRQGVGVVLA